MVVKTEKEEDSKAEMKNSIVLLYPSPVSNTVPEVMQFVDPVGVDTGTSSVCVDEIDPLSDLKEELVSCCTIPERTAMEDAIQNGSCIHPLIKPCFVHLLRMDIPGDLPIDVQQLFPAGSLHSQSSDAVLLQAECSDNQTLKAVSSDIDSTFQTLTNSDQGEDFIIPVRRQEPLDENLCCEQYLKAGKHSAYNTVSLTDTIKNTTKCIHFEKLDHKKYHRKPHYDVHHKKHIDQNFVCDKEFTHVSKLSTHMCPPCDNSFSKNSNRRAHMTYHTQKRPYQCSECDKAFTTNCNLKTHMRLHSGERPYHCSECDISFSDRSNLISHMRYHTGKRPYTCSHCDKAFTQKCILGKHIRIHSVHRPYQCSQCEKSFTQKSNLERHTRVHSGERPYHCSQCEKSFSEKASLTSHLMCHSGERPFHCFECDKTFRTHSHRKRHMSLHLGECPYLCSQCDKSFSEMSALKIHFRCHSGERPYQCFQCQKSFGGSSNLKRHMMLHSGELRN